MKMLQMALKNAQLVSHEKEIRIRINKYRTSNSEA